MSVEYKEIPGFEGYRVGDDGSVWSLWKRGKGEAGSNWVIGNDWNLMKLGKDLDGYPQVKFAGERKTKKVHNLVLQIFVGKRPVGMQACHNNGNPSDNSIRNLRWDTPKNNQADRFIHMTDNLGSKNGRSKLTEDQVRQIKVKHKLGQSGSSLSKEFNMHRSVICKICNGSLWGQIEIV